MKIELDLLQIACIRHALIVERDAAYAKALDAIDAHAHVAIAEAQSYAELCTRTIIAFDAQAHRDSRETRRAEQRLCGAIGAEQCRWAPECPPCSECLSRG